ncbi:MAG: DUF29 domain-containing protein [Allosphingosinicella sp.]
MADLDTRRTRRANRPAYEEDYAAWLATQINLLKERRFAELDLDHLIDEVGDLGINDFKALVSAVRVVILHMLKWDYQPERRSRSWRNSIHEHRYRIAESLEASPSYKRRQGDVLERAYQQALFELERETTIPRERLPSECPFSWDEMMSRLHDFDADKNWDR